MDFEDIDLSELEPRVIDWINADPDPQTAGELQDLLARANCDAPDMATANRDEALVELADRFRTFLEFGTAGLRGRLGGGPNRMNRAVVIKTAAGLGNYLTKQLPDASDIRVVIGFDARHRSDEFAHDSAAVLTAQGKEVFLLTEPVPTPVLAFAIRQFGAEAAIMVTASHNPPQDNGYKVYLGGRLTRPEATGVQIVSPADAQIAQAIAATGDAKSITRAESGWEELDEEIAGSYLEALKDLPIAPLTPETADERSKLRIAYTPLHGVGAQFAEPALTQAGFLDLHIVGEQHRPDPDFPTVVFPNPEEPGAMDLALKLAHHVSADIIIANDPDADRCAIAARHPDTSEFHMLHGDEVGALLAEYLVQQVPSDSAVASSIVSSRLIEKIAERHGVRHEVTLTGFKWIARVPGLVYGYEEALGYCVAPDIVRDKDGISTAVLVAALAAQLKARGKTLFAALNDLARAHDLFATDQLSARFTDQAEISLAVRRLLADPPETLLDAQVSEARDLAAGFNGLPPTPGMWLRTVNNARVVVRPSGTEPKLKCYLEVVLPVAETATDAEISATRNEAATALGQLKTELAQHLGLR